MRRRFFADELSGAAAVVTGPNAIHLRRVLRAQVGQQYELAFAGAVYLATIAGLESDRIRFAVVEPLPQPPPPPPVHLAAAVFKFDRLEWMIEKATELGVASIQLLATRRTDPRLVASAASRLPRWRTILRDAAQQSRRADWPALAPPIDLSTFLARPAAGRRILLSEDSAAPPLRLTPDAAQLLTGPEGGWTEAESAAAAEAGFAPASLGPRILRCETAALAALARLGADA